MPTETYARKVVSDLLEPTSKAWLWRGHQSNLVRWLSWLLPRGFWVSNSSLIAFPTRIFSDSSRTFTFRENSGLGSCVHSVERVGVFGLIQNSRLCIEAVFGMV